MSTSRDRYGVGAGRVYRHQWFVRPRRCEDAPILGRERVVSDLRR
ncbi:MULTISPECIES: hypothetical protein [unclassified Streptomyces]|nr:MULTISPECIES: hypothetical protein [unclassified Streptomyces]WSP58446.1 hypothetical protein OG306_31715 [Streptomyces sp. NBC_01241]WSU20980.1 hypothetical protein OG508_08290 [Streptomyces sp. NBC_01108]MCX4790205.1 hypothetical protein [Streptomyces sp. NBC_01221]MCX4794066.1 hypothetical protein [Streptomyces sp. NBC_01242]WSJ35471.1 hypothetical protein OG772_05005 [Streptomyces sp. NBC_01321]